MDYQHDSSYCFLSMTLSDFDDDHDDDIMSTTGATLAGDMGVSQMELPAECLLENIRNAMDFQMERERSLQESITQQIELATARYSNGTTYGTTLCMNKVGRIKLERDKVDSVIEILEMHSHGLRGQAGSSASHFFVQNNSSGSTTSYETMSTMDLDADRHYEQ